MHGAKLMGRGKEISGEKMWKRSGAHPHNAVRPKSIRLEAPFSVVNVPKLHSA
jgi:hypothetical protein